MYNTDITIDYDTIDGDEGDTNYRKQILSFLNLTEYGDEVSKKIDLLHDTHKNNPSIKRIMPWVKLFLEQRWPFEMDDKTRFLFLFSFDFFYLMFPIISTLINNSNPKEKQIEDIIHQIKSKFKS